jgi:hypothetical protein
VAGTVDRGLDWNPSTEYVNPKEREAPYDLGQAEVRSDRPLLRGHVLPVHPVGKTSEADVALGTVQGRVALQSARALEEIDARVRFSGAER